MPIQTILEKQQDIQILVGCKAFKQPEFFMKIESETKEVSLKKCMAGLTEAYKDQIEQQANSIYDNTIIHKLPTYLKKIIERFPAFKTEILHQINSNFPHKERPDIVKLLVY